MVIYDESFEAKILNHLPPPSIKKGHVTSEAEDSGSETPVAGADPELPLNGPILTKDQRNCLGVCTTNPIPGMEGAPEPPIESALGQPDFGPGVTVEEGLDGDDLTYNEPIDNPNGQHLKCQTLGTDTKIKGPTGKHLRFQCPRGCLADVGIVVGTQIYADNSSVCRSAIHSGMLSDEGGEVIVIISNGEENYKSSY